MSGNASNNKVTGKERAAGLRTYQSVEEQENDRLREAMRRTPDEKFAFLMELMRMQRLMKGAKWVKQSNP